jgi:cytochrome c
VRRVSNIPTMFTFIATVLFTLQGCNSAHSKPTANLTGGNPSAGKEKIDYYGCAACHEIPGVDIAQGRVGPSLQHIASRSYLAGKLPNSPQNMASWIQRPQEFLPHTAMPNMGISEADSRDITAYLYSLR